MDYPFQPVPFTRVRVTGGFWHERQEVNRRVTLPFALLQCEESGRLRNFDLAAEVMQRRAAGEATLQFAPPTIYPFDDTDAYKVIEAASYVLDAEADVALAKKLDGWIARIAAAQEPDGYLYTFRTMHPDSEPHEWSGSQRWEKESELSHELYNAGHLYEAGVAHFAATRSRTLLEVCLRNAELLWREFGHGTRRVAPGHQIVEMGLVKLYRATSDERWLRLARIFLEVRGPGGEKVTQQHQRVVDQTEAVGHAVRANYQYAAMADIAALCADSAYLRATTLLWENVVGRKLYLTGGVGALTDGEAYGDDYDLRLNGYNETCAALALMNWSHRLFLLTGAGRYMDVFERVAHNGFLSGVSLSGDRFFYQNPLEYDGVSENHGHAGRAPWFGCACCPPNLLRTLAAFSGYFYATRASSLYVNVYAESEGVVQVADTTVQLTQATDYPWQGRIRLQLAPAVPAVFALRLRIPGWVRGEPVPSELYRYEETNGLPWTVEVSGVLVDAPVVEGYAVVEREWRAGDVVELYLPLETRRVRGHERVDATRGRVAFERGPLVYCVEQLDAEVPLSQLSAPPRTTATPAIRPGVLGKITSLQVEPPGLAGFDAVPYFTWNNRGLGAMAVWLPVDR